MAPKRLSQATPQPSKTASLSSVKPQRAAEAASSPSPPSAHFSPDSPGFEDASAQQTPPHLSSTGPRHTGSPSSTSARRLGGDRHDTPRRRRVEEGGVSGREEAQGEEEEPQLVPPVVVLSPPKLRSRPSELSLPHVRASSSGDHSHRCGAACSAAAAHNAQYRENWSRVVLGATSGIMFVLVVALCYALYVLATPYYNAITSGVLLSIVMHPQSQLRSVLYMGTAVDRMRHVQQRWAARGRLAGVVGSWLSLRHFASFVVMQLTFFLGLNKIRVPAHSLLLGRDASRSEGPVARGRVKGAAPPTVRPRRARESASAGESRIASPQPRASPKGAAKAMPWPGSDTPQWRDSAGVGDDDDGAATRRLAYHHEGTANHQATGSGSSSEGGSGESLPAASAAASSTASRSRAFPFSAALLQQSPRNASVALTPNGRELAPPSSSSLAEVVGHHPSLPVAAPGHRRLVSTARGRRVLRYLTIATLLVVAHLLVGVLYFAVLHAALFLVFALRVPFMQAETFVQGMGRLWRVAIAVFFMVGLTVNLTADVVSISHTVRRTTSAVVGGSGGGSGADGGGPVTAMLSTLMEMLPPQLQSMVQQNPSSSSISGDGGVLDEAARYPFFRSGGSQRVAEAGHAGSDSPHTSSSPSAPPAAHTWATVRSWTSMNAIKSLVYAWLPHSATTQGNEHVTPHAAAAASHGDAVHIDWATALRLPDSRLLPYVEHALRLLMLLASSLMGLFDSIYAVVLFIFFYRYLTQLEHTVLYYGVAKVLRVMQPEMGDAHARHIEHDITVSFTTLLQSFWHLTWFHFCITFCAFKLWAFPTPFLLGLVSVVLALFPLVPKWLSPCSVALVYMIVQLVSLTIEDVGSPDSGDSHHSHPLLFIPPGQPWWEARVFGKPYVLAYARALSFALALMLECGDEWLLCVSRGLRGGFVTEAAGKGREQLQPFVVGTALVLGFVAYGIRGIVFGPLTVIVARVVYDNWDVVLSSEVVGGGLLPPPPAPPRSLLAEEEDNDEEEEEGEEDEGGRGDSPLHARGIGGRR